MSSSSSSSSGIGFCGLLTIVLITLKLLNLIQISWLWVIMPILLIPIIGLGFLCVGGIIFLSCFIYYVIQSVIVKQLKRK